MNPDHAFERILASLYEAALDDGRWSAATALIEEVVGASGNALIVGEGLDEPASTAHGQLPIFMIPPIW